MENLTRATILIDRDKWKRFRKICKAKNLDASKQIRMWIDKFLADNSQLFLEIEGKKGDKNGTI